MVNITSKIVSILKLATKRTYLSYPDDFSKLPCISYVESNNVDEASGTNLEYAGLEYEFKFWSKNPIDIWSLVSIVDTNMKDIGFKKDFTSPEIKDNNGIYCKTLRYKAIVDSNNRVFQNLR